MAAITTRVALVSGVSNDGPIGQVVARARM